MNKTHEGFGFCLGVLLCLRVMGYQVGGYLDFLLAAGVLLILAYVVTACAVMIANDFKDKLKRKTRADYEREIEELKERVANLSKEIENLYRKGWKI